MLIDDFNEWHKQHTGTIPINKIQAALDFALSRAISIVDDSEDKIYDHYCEEGEGVDWKVTDEIDIAIEKLETIMSISNKGILHI